MNENLFAELLDSVCEGGAILLGEKAPSRKFEIEASDVSESTRMLKHQSSLQGVNWNDTTGL